jgi:hypothetical protein
VPASAARLQFESLFLCRTMRVWEIADCPGVLGGGSPREHTVANQALAHVLTDDDEYLADLVSAGGTRVSLGFIVSSHVDQQ